jgi:hypothetical protein
MTPEPRTWQRIIHEIKLAGGSLPAHIALRRAGYCGDPTGLTSATRHEPRLCEWTGARNVIWLGIVDGDGELPVTPIASGPAPCYTPCSADARKGR